MFKNLVEIEAARISPLQKKGRPRMLSFDEAFDNILKVVRTGMQWRYLRPERISYITVFKQMHMWTDAKVFQTAYSRLLKLYCRRRRPKY